MIVLEDRTVPTVVTISAVADAHEGGSNGEFTVSRDTTSGSLTANLSWSGTATEGFFSDYMAPMVVSFAGGSSTATILITGNDHSSTPEPTETIIGTVASGTGYTVGSPSSATINLFNNGPDVVSVAKTADAVEGGTNGVLEFTRIGNLSSSLTANISVSGTATSGTDYTSIGSTVTFAAGSAVTDVNVTALSDNLVEGSETLVATLTSGTGYTIASPPPSATVNIADDPPVISVMNGADAQEGGGDGSFVLTRTGGDLTSSLTVSYSVDGTATSGTQYTALSGSVTFAANSDTAVVDVATIDDGIYDPGLTAGSTHLICCESL